MENKQNNNIFAHKNLIENRQIRIFISSTFKDMDAERNYLINNIFPGLRRYCAERDVTLVELDLRWGVTEEEGKQGKVVEICLKEIENAHPFFIGLLGERYGWVPDKNDIATMTQTLEEYPWLKSDLEKEALSITEIEMQYGVLRSKEDLNAYFYFRSPSMDVPDNADFKDPKNSPEWQKLQRLKAQIRAQEKYPKYDYDSVEALGKQIEQDFKVLVDKLFPDGNLSLLEKERLAHKAFLHSHTEVYIENKDNLQQIDDFLQSSSEALVICGESGLGKSTLIANWIIKRSAQLDRKLIYHFVGNSSAEGDYHKITQRLINEIKALYDLPNEQNEIHQLTKGIGNQKEELQKLLLDISNRDELLIIIDGINKLADLDNAKLMNWLPTFPESVKIIYSTLADDSTMNVFIRRKYDFFMMETLSKSEQEKLINDYLHLFGKSLYPSQVKKITENKLMNNTLVLRTLLDELRVFGKHEKIDDEINRYISVSNINDFFNLVLERLEKTYNYDDANFVYNVFSLIAVSRTGLSETEIQQITKATQLNWSWLFNAAISHLTLQNGLIVFSHQYLREAVWKRYLNQKTTENKTREQIVDYMENSLEVTTNRKYDEYPYQIYELKNLDKLYDFLSNLEVFDYIAKKDIYEIGKYWKILVETDESKYTLRRYAELIDESNLNDLSAAQLYLLVGIFIHIIFGDNSKAIEYFAKSLFIYTLTLGPEHPDMANIYLIFSDIYNQQGDYKRAMDLAEKSLKIKNKQNDSDDKNLAFSFLSMATNYTMQGNYPNALEYYGKALDVAEKTVGADNIIVADIFNNLAIVHRKLQNYSAALEYYSKSLLIKEQSLGLDHPKIAETFSNIGAINFTLGNFTQALENQEKAYTILEKTLWVNHPTMVKLRENIDTTLDSINKKNNRAVSYFIDQGDGFITAKEYKSALLSYQKALSIINKYFDKNHPDLILLNKKIDFLKKGDYINALENRIDANNNLSKPQVMNLLNKGEINKAEDLLFENLETNFVDDLFEIAYEFYKKLRTYNNVWLVEHNFSSQEVEDGWKDFQREFFKRKQI
jgi:Tfp pilus assembly protein PilF